MFRRCPLKPKLYLKSAAQKRLVLWVPMTRYTDDNRTKLDLGRHWCVLGLMIQVIESYSR
jgi:hypothetical protein